MPRRDAGSGSAVRKGDAAVVEAFLVAEAREAAATAAAADMGQLLEAMARRMVLPVLAAAEVSDDPFPVLGFLSKLDRAALAKEISDVAPTSSLEEGELADALEHASDWAVELERSTIGLYSQLEDGLRESGTRRGGDMADWLSDMRRLAADRLDEGRRVGEKRGIVNLARSSRRYAKAQAGIYGSMSRNASSVGDVSIWYGRYVIAPMIPIAGDGFFELARSICAADDSDLKRDCCDIANELGIACSPDDIDPDALRCSMRQVCRSRTGYCFVQNYIASLSG